MSNISYSVLDDLINSGQLVTDPKGCAFVFADQAQPKLILSGSGNTGLRQDYADGIASENDKSFMSSAEVAIWLSAYASNNPISDHHWHADACYYEARRRGNPELYNRAWNRARATAL